MQVAGITSDALGCLAIGAAAPAPASGVVHLTWQGRVDRARLVLTVSGAEVAHTIRVNGQPAAHAPIHPAGGTCSGGEPFYLDIPPELLLQGENRIEITSSAGRGDARLGDDWSAANVRLQVLGDLVLDIPDPTAPHDPGASALQAQGFVIRFTSPYDGSTQEAVAQVPAGYDSGVPTPLVVFAHGRNDVMETGIDMLGGAANAQGWLLASPQMHGSWTGEPQPDPPGKVAYASLESQYDIAGTVRSMVDRFNVKVDQIYLVGYSMGGQIAVVTAAKFPHVFAAVFDNMGPTGMATWYGEQERTHQRWMERECHINGVPQTPAQNPFCYQRRSGLSYALNYAHIPISITHSLADQLVPAHHASDLRSRIVAYHPDHAVSVYWDREQGPTCPPYHHCLQPDPGAVLRTLGAHTLESSPTRIYVTSDEIKSVYWLNLAPEAGDAWTMVAPASYDRANARVEATLFTTGPTDVGLNLGATPTTGPAGVPQPGMGLPPATYRVEINGTSYDREYAYGYLNVHLPAAGRYDLRLSALSPCDTAGLIRAIERANSAGGPITLRLQRSCTYALSAVHNQANGPNGLPSITGRVIIEGNGATIARSSAPGTPDLRPWHVSSGGSLTLKEVSVRNGVASYGGGIYNRGGEATLIDTTLRDNSATYGGAIYNRRGAALRLVNSTVSGNQAGEQGGGIANADGTLDLTNSTVTENRAAGGFAAGGGIYLASGARMVVRSTIVAHNPAGGDCAISRARDATSEGYNLDGDGTCGLDPAQGDRSNANPGLAPLLVYGGATPTHGLFYNSPALDPIPTGINGCGSSPLDADQRGQRRPADGDGQGGAQCDMGAFERQGNETLIGLISWTATADLRAVRLAWQTGIEAGNLGFYLWRSEGDDRSYARINQTRIPARGGSAHGASYSYVDTKVPGPAYYYKLEAVNSSGGRTFYGPVAARLGWIERVYLPLVSFP
jgi:pimeloyl-ACP methyl ester carboxylesterase